MPPDAPGCEAVRRLVPADKRHGSAQPGSGHCGHVVEIDHAVRSPFLRYPRATCARATKIAILAGRRNFTKESKGPSERSALQPGGMSSGQGAATSPCCSRSCRARPAECKQQKPANSACRRLPKSTRQCHGREGPVRRLWSCTVRSAWVSGATLRTKWASDAMVVFTARERKVRTPKSIA